MESQEYISSSEVAALLRQKKSEILSDFTQKQQMKYHSDSCLRPILPDLFEKILQALDGNRGHDAEPPAAWLNLPLGPMICELCLLRDVLGSFLPRCVDLIRLHRFLDRCLETAVSTHEHIEHEAQERLYSFFHLVPTPVCVVEGEERRITFANSAYEKFVGRSARGKKLEDVFTSDELKDFIPLIDRVYETGTPSFLNEMHVPVSVGPGEPADRWIDLSYYPLGGVGYQARGVITVFYDVTDRVINRTKMQRSELRLKKTEEQLIRAVTVSKVGFFDWDLRQDLIHLNKQMRLDWGTEQEVLTPDELEALIHPDDRENTRVSGRVAIADHTPYFTQCRVIRPSDKKTVWIEVQGEITYDDDNRPLRFFGTSRNITERKEAEIKLAAEKHKFEVIFRDSPAPMALWRGPDAVFELVNPQFEIFFHGRNFIGKPLHEALPEFKDQPILKLIKQVYETGQTFSAKEFSAKIARFSGGPLEDAYVDFSLTRIEDDEGKPYGVFSHSVNVTDKVKARDEARAASLSKSHFLANMSHEIRTPLAAILGFSALLRDPQLPESEREVFVDTIVRNGQALTRIIDDILDLAKVEAGRLEMEMVDFSLPALIDEVLALFRDRIQQKKLQLVADIDASVPDHISSDPLRLRQILVNLVGNAVKFTSKGSVRISCRAQETAGVFTFTMDVKDTGIGLSPDQIARLFQPFVQADNSTTRKFGGTGLGLALSQRLAEALGGHITVTHSVPGEGSTFSLQFMAHEARTPHESQLKTPTQILEPYQLCGIRVLAVDDSPDNLFLVKSFLAKSGALVATAADGCRAIELASSHDYDIILMDIQMPEMDGYQAIRILRERGFNKPIVALTAHAMADERHHTETAGFNAHLVKPLDARELVATVARLARSSPTALLGGLQS